MITFYKGHWQDSRYLDKDDKSLLNKLSQNITIKKSLKSYKNDSVMIHMRRERYENKVLRKIFSAVSESFNLFKRAMSILCQLQVPNSNMTTLIFYPSITFRLRFSPRKLFFETSNGRLPLEHGSDRCQTLGKRVSDDPRRFIIRCRQFCFFQKFLVSNQERAVLEEVMIF